MKSVLLLLGTFAALACLTVSAEANTYVVKNIGKTGLKNSCARGGGTFTDGENSYYCTYKNGNVRECSKRDGHCVVETPPKSGRIDPQVPAGDLGGLGTFGAMESN